MVSLLLGRFVLITIARCSRLTLFSFSKGTPTFIARSVSAGRPLAAADMASSFRRMPTLSGDAKAAYVRAYKEDTYNMYCDTHDTIHGSTPPPGSAKLPPFEFCHRPDHDVESIFWVLLFTLLRAQPYDATEDVDLELFWTTNQCLLDHVIQSKARFDTRDSLLTFSEETMAEALNSKLAPLSGMLADMAAQVRPEYGYLSPSPRKDHLHEAMRRLLLQQIVGMKDDIKLRPGVSRPLSPDDNQITGNKRKSQRQGGTNGKRSRLSASQSRTDRPQHQR